MYMYRLRNRMNNFMLTTRQRIGMSDCLTQSGTNLLLRDRVLHAILIPVNKKIYFTPWKCAVLQR